MPEFYNLLFNNLNLKYKRVLDAATGAGESLYYLAKEAEKQGNKTEIISVDIEQPQEWIEKIQKKLGPNSKLVNLIEADIFNLNTIPDNSIDIINCHDTLLFLNPKPLKIVSAFKEFRRVLKNDGILLITSELPLDDFSNEEYLGQLYRWNFAKAVMSLKNSCWSNEVYPEEITVLLEEMGFQLFEQHNFKPSKIKDVKETLIEWKVVMKDEIKNLDWNSEFRKALYTEVEKIYDKIENDGYMTAPSQFILKFKLK